MKTVNPISSSSSRMSRLKLGWLMNSCYERFLNPERVSLPDIDVDFDPEGRARVIEYCGEKYGTDKVASA